MKVLAEMSAKTSADVRRPCLLLKGRMRRNLHEAFSLRSNAQNR
ncbi:hypothetical protein BOMU111920_18830 [Bordetella muralis]